MNRADAVNQTLEGAVSAALSKDSNDICLAIQVADGKLPRLVALVSDNEAGIRQALAYERTGYRMFFFEVDDLVLGQVLDVVPHGCADDLVAEGS